MVVDGLNKFTDYSVAPFLAARELRESVIENDLLNDGGCSWTDQLQSRALFLAQAVVSAVAIPLNLLALLFSPLLGLCIDESDGTTWDIVTGLYNSTLLHLSMIPTSLIASILPHSVEWDSPTKEIAEYIQR